MPKKPVDLLANAKRAVDRVFRDGSVPQSQTSELLREIIEHCDERLEALEDDDQWDEEDD